MTERKEKSKELETLKEQVKQLEKQMKGLQIVITRLIGLHSDEMGYYGLYLNK
jgi:hypothetical protein